MAPHKSASMVPRHDAHVVKLRLMVGLCDGWMGLIACPLITMIVLWGAADIVRYPPPLACPDASENTDEVMARLYD